MYKIAFTGPYPELKALGFEFQKLYASNYMQWHHEDSDLRVWKKGAEVTCNQYPDDMTAQLLVMLEHGVRPNKYMGLYIAYWNTVQKYASINDDDYKMAQIVEGVPYPSSWREVTIKPETIDMLINLKERGWIQSERLE